MNELVKKAKNVCPHPVNGLPQTCLAVTGTSLMTLGVLNPQAAKAIVIDFNGLQESDFPSGVQNGSTWFAIGTSYVEDGFELVEDGRSQFNFWRTNAPEYPGSVAIQIGSGGDTASLTQVNGGLFTLSSIDLATLYSTQPVSVTFNGLKSDSSTVTQSFTTSALRATLENFTFSPDFTNLVSVTWTQDVPYHQFDNINVSPIATAVPWETDALPIIGSTVILGLGLWAKGKLTKTKLK